MIATNQNIEILALGSLALMLAATMQPGLVWLGVAVAYIAFMRSSSVPILATQSRRGYTLITCNVAPRLSICVVLRQNVAPSYNVWQMVGVAK